LLSAASRLGRPAPGTRPILRFGAAPKMARERFTRRAKPLRARTVATPTARLTWTSLPPAARTAAAAEALPAPLA
jgi:hypothetical protein